MRNGFEDLDLDRLRRRRSDKWRAHPPDVLPAFIAEMDYDLAEPLLAALRGAIDLSDCGYATPADVGETFARFAAARHGWTVDPGHVHLVPDVMAGVDVILRLATEPGDGVVINTPVYPPFFEHITGGHRRVVEVPLVRVDGRHELDFAGLEAAFAAGARGYLLCNPHNPTGRAVAGSASRQRLLARLPSSCQYGAGLFGVLASLAVWSSGDEWLDALLAQLDHARTEFGRLLRQRLPEAGYVPPEASYLAWVDCSRLALGPEPAEVFLDRGRVALGRGLNFGPPGDGFVRVTIGTSSALLAEIVDRMAAAVG